MNRLTYYLLNKINDFKVLDQNFLDSLYNLYKYDSEEFNFATVITKEEFNVVFNTIYDILKLIINEDEFIAACNHYLNLIMYDAMVGGFVDINWFINHIWYLCVGETTGVDTQKYKDCIPFLQQTLINKFNIEENLKEKLVRKLRTRSMLNIKNS